MIDKSIYIKIFEKAPYGVLISDGEGYYKYVNEETCSMTGYSFNELVGMNMSEFTEIENISAVFAKVENNVVICDKVSYCTKKGEKRIWRIKVIKVDDDNLISFTEDITEIEDYIKRLERVEKIGHVGSWEFDVETGMLWGSAEAIGMFGENSVEGVIRAGDLLNKYIVQKDKLMDSIKNTIKTGTPFTVEYEINHVSRADKRIMTASGIPIIDDGRVIKIHGTTRDITESKNAEMRITEEKNRLSQYLEIAGVMLLVLDNTGRVRIINKRGCEILGYSEEDIVGKVWTEKFVPQQIARKIDDIQREVLYESSVKYIKHENKVVTASGEEKTILWHNTVICDMEGNTKGTLSSGEDITEIRKVEKALKKSEELLKKAEIITNSGHWEHDLFTSKTYWSDGFYILMGYEPRCFIPDGGTDKKFMLPKSYERYMNVFHDAIRNEGNYEVEIEGTRKDGKVITMVIKGIIEYDEKQPVKVIGTVQDITGRREHLDKIEYISYHDQLTGLYNRRFLEEEFKRLDVKRNYPITIIMTDVNGLKLTNDTFGHAEGDIMLKDTAEILKSSCREDDIIARLAGDEFIILMPKTTKKDAEKIIKRITIAVQKHESGKLPMSMAIGFAIKTDEKQDREVLLKNAEDRMYRNKLQESSSRNSEAIRIITETLYKLNKREEGHSTRVSELCVKIGETVGMTKAEINELRIVGLFHDIGKIAVRENLLDKPDKLSEEEFENIKRHSETGYRILSTSNDMADLAGYVLSHHERWDGKGYPRGLKEDEIPLQSRIIALADAYDAMTREQPYRKALPSRKIYNEIRKNAGKQFDPEIAKSFLLKVMPKL